MPSNLIKYENKRDIVYVGYSTGGTPNKNMEPLTDFVCDNSLLQSNRRHISDKAVGEPNKSNNPNELVQKQPLTLRFRLTAYAIASIKLTLNIEQ